MILISDIANQINGTIEGNPNLKISGVCDIKKGNKGKITFLSNLNLELVATEEKPNIPITGKKIPRNSPCPCGSGKKYKHCCGVL